MSRKESQRTDKLSAPAEKPGSRLPHLERLVTGSRITIHSFTSPYLQKYSFRPSGKQNKTERKLIHTVDIHEVKEEYVRNGNFSGFDYTAEIFQVKVPPNLLLNVSKK